MKKIAYVLVALLILSGCNSNDTSYENTEKEEDISKTEISENLEDTIKIEGIKDEDITITTSESGYKRLTINITLDNLDSVLGINTANIIEKDPFGEVKEEYTKTGYYSKLFKQGWHYSSDEDFAYKCANGKVFVQGWTLFQISMKTDSIEEFLSVCGIEDIKGKLIFNDLSRYTVEDGKISDGVLTQEIDLNFPY